MMWHIHCTKMTAHRTLQVALKLRWKCCSPVLILSKYPNSGPQSGWRRQRPVLRMTRTFVPASAFHTRLTVGK